MLHVTSWNMAAVRTDVTCYVKLFVLTEQRCYMLRHGIWLELGQMRSSGNGGGSRRNTCFGLLADSCTKKPLDENAPEKKKKNTLISKACIYQKKWPKTQVLDTWRKEFDQIPCRYEVAIRMALPIQNAHSTVN